MVRTTTARGDLVAMTPEVFARHFPDAIASDENRDAYFAGFKLRVGNLDATRTCWADNGIYFEDTNGTLWVRPEYGFGCVIAVVEAD